MRLLKIRPITITTAWRHDDDGSRSLRLVIEGLPEELVEPLTKAMMEASMDELAKHGRVLQLDRDPGKPLQ